MDVDKAIELLVSEGARLDALHAQLAVQVQQLAEQQQKTDAQQQKTTDQLRTAVRLGTAMSRRAFKAIDALAEHGRATEQALAALAQQQGETAATLRAFIDNTERRWGGNGPGPRPGA